MKKLIGYTLLLSFIFGGWVLAAASLHVVRVPADPAYATYMPLKVAFVPKNKLCFKQTWIDTTKWTQADVVAQSEFVNRLDQAGKSQLISHAKNTPAPADLNKPEFPQASVTAPVEETKKHQTSIFDMPAKK